MSSRARRVVGLGTGVVVCVGALTLAISRLDGTRIVASLLAVRPGWMIAGAVCYLLLLPLWALQWSLIAPRTPRSGPRDMLAVVAMTSSILNTTPFLVGESAAVLFLVSRAGLDRMQSVGVLVMDQLLVGLAKVGVLALAYTLVSPAEWLTRGLGVLVLLLAAALVGALVSRRYVSSVREVLARGVSPGAIALAFVKKATEAAAMLCVQRAFGIHLELSSVILVLAALNLATLVPVSPGNLGIYEGAVVVAYRHYGVALETATAIAVVQHAVYFAVLALPGYGWLAREGVIRARLATS